jgi:hypothetical protein
LRLSILPAVHSRRLFLSAFLLAKLSCNGFTQALHAVQDVPSKPRENSFLDDWDSDTAEDIRIGSSIGSRPGDFSESRFELSGLIDQGITWNPDSPRDRLNGPLLYNDRANEYQLNLFYASLSRSVDRDTADWGLGGTVDLVFGTAGRFLQVPGLEQEADLTDRWNSEGRRFYKLALPQLHAELFVPVSDGIVLRAGRFYSVLGFPLEVAENFMLSPYSFGVMESFAVPFTHTGMTVETEVGGGLDVLAGFTRGLDNWTDNNDDLGFLGRLRWRSDSGGTIAALAIHTADEDDRGESNVTIVSLSLQHALSKLLTLRLLNVTGRADDSAPNSFGGFDDAEWYGVSQQLQLTIYESLHVSVRGEWYRDDDHLTYLTTQFGVPHDLATGGDYYSLTFALQWFVQDNVVVRPEVRWDWSNTKAPLFGINGVFNDLAEQDQFTAALGVSFLF